MRLTRQRRRTSAALVLGLVSVALAGCGGDDGGGGEDSGSGETQKLVVYSAEPGSAEGYQQALAAFEEEKDVEVEIVSYESADFLTQFPNAVRAKSQIDVLLANGQDVRTLVSQDLLTPLEDFDSSTMIEPAIAPFEIDGKQYAVGVNTMYTTGVAVNTALLEQYGLQQPTTFDELTAAAAKLQGSGVSLMSVPGGNIYLWPIWYMQTLQQAAGGDPTELTQQTLQGEVPFTDERYVEAMTALQELGAAGIFQPGYAGVDQDGANATMAQQKALMFYGGTWDIQVIADQADYDLAVTSFPTYVDGVESLPAGGAAIAAAVYAGVDDSRADLAQDLVRYLASPEGSQATLEATKAGFPLPTTKGVEVEASPAAQEVSSTLAPKTFTFLDWSWPKQVTAAFQQAIPAVVGGQQAPDAAMAEVQKAFESAKSEGWAYG